MIFIFKSDLFLLPYLLQLNLNHALTKKTIWILNMISRLWPTYVIAMNNLATVTDNESDIEVNRHCSTSKDFNLVN